MTTTGYRWWYARRALARPGDEKPTVPTLRSWAQAFDWQPGVNRATCQHWCGPWPHDAPAHNCECGFWALTEPAWLPGMFPLAARRDGFGQPGYAFGEVEMWGECLFTERGTRAEYARVVSLSTPPYPFGDQGEVERIAARYGVPVVPFPLEGLPPGMEFVQSVREAFERSNKCR